MASKPWGSLPVTRVHTIMKSSSDAELISRESALTMSKAAEIFIKLLSEDGYKLTSSGKRLEYKHVAEVVHSDERYEFLREMMPKKITVLEYKKILAKRENANREEDDDDDDEEDEEDDDDDDESSSSKGSASDFESD